MAQWFCLQLPVTFPKHTCAFDILLPSLSVSYAFNRELILLHTFRIHQSADYHPSANRPLLLNSLCWPNTCVFSIDLPHCSVLFSTFTLTREPNSIKAIILFLWPNLNSSRPRTSQFQTQNFNSYKPRPSTFKMWKLFMIFVLALLDSYMMVDYHAKYRPQVRLVLEWGNFNVY